MNTTYISKFFKPNEFKCKCCGATPPMSVFLLMQLDLLRIAVNKPIHVTSGYRCPKHNKKVGGAKKSQHMTCKAADIWVENFTTTELATIAKKVGFDFILIEPSWIHVDMRNHLIS